MTIQTRPVKSTNGHHEQTVAHANGANGSQRHGYAPHAYATSSAHVQATLAQVRKRIAPLWPLRHFVAVNPFLGMADYDFAATARTMAQRAGAKLTAPRAFYAAAIADGRMTSADLAAALAEAEHVAGAPHDVESLCVFAATPATDAAFALTPTVADAAQQVTGRDWSRLATESISRWAAAHFDQGQAYWTSPWRDLPAYAAWREEALLDRTAEVAGVRGFRRTVRNLPASAPDAIAAIVAKLGVPPAGLEAYLHRLLMTVGGWAGYARYLLWEAELDGRFDSSLDELLAVRLAWELALYNAFMPEGVDEAWAACRHELAAPRLNPAADAELAGDLLLQTAFEKAYQRTLIATMATVGSQEMRRGRVQAAFCIDVRSEVFRRAFESVADDVETIGFAGFFGFPIEYVRLGDDRGGAQCPVLLKPQFVVHESVLGADTDTEQTAGHTRMLHRRVAKAWRTFKFGAVACFAFVGPVGLAYVKKLVSDSLGLSRPVEHPAAFGLDQATVAKLGPTLDSTEMAGRITGMTPGQRLDVAEGVLKAMSLTDNFARLVLLVGHGASTVNNPHASGLDCGACGGHTGEANARVAARVLNDPDVRAGLARRGIHVPADTVFVACQHDTTTDAVTLFDKALIPASHAQDVVVVEQQLAAAGRMARAERARLLKIDQGTDIDKAITARSRDWSQVRPEWGLAGCASFIVAPRARTQSLDLGGRAFLHSYDWRQDNGFGVLELIMTAPMVVASWINLQYYASTVDNRVFGSGNKALHNVVGALGVLEGNGGDLRVGLPWQSVHDGERYIHEPLRLNVLIGAPIEAMNDIIARHEGVRQLLDNGWVHLFALAEDGTVSRRYAGDLRWRSVAEEEATAAESYQAANHWLN
ncbi:MAG: DUF2309 domain-containing protein [Caldilineaceae bacterium]